MLFKSEHLLDFTIISGMLRMHLQLITAEIPSNFSDAVLELYCSKRGLVVSRDTTVYTLVNGMLQPAFMGYVVGNDIGFVGWNFTRCLFSEDGLLWKDVTPNGFQELNNLFTAGDYFFISEYNQLLFSSDGLNWKRSMLSLPIETMSYAFIDGKERYITSLSNGSIYFSSDAITWTLWNAELPDPEGTYQYFISALNSTIIIAIEETFDDIGDVIYRGQ